MIEGFTHTRNVWKYAFRLLLFSIISEVPFDLAFRGSVFDTSYQNVFFTLFIGFVTMMAYKWVEEKGITNVVTRILCQILVVMVGMALAQSP